MTGNSMEGKSPCSPYLKAINIQWDIDIDEAYAKLDEMTSDAAAEAIGVPKDKYANMTTEERHDFAYDLWHHNRSSLEEFMGLPNEVEIPDPDNPDWDDETIANYLSDEFGFCHEGFEVISDLRYAMHNVEFYKKAHWDNGFKICKAPWDIGFKNPEGKDDEVQFDASSADELLELWLAFSKENKNNPNAVLYVQEGEES